MIVFFPMGIRYPCSRYRALKKPDTKDIRQAQPHVTRTQKSLARPLTGQETYFAVPVVPQVT
jgi:hypothetical protein